MDDLLPDLTLAFNETFQMLSISTLLANYWRSAARFSYFRYRPAFILAETVLCICSAPCWNIIRSVPFVILLVLLLPLTQFCSAIPLDPSRRRFRCR